MTFVYNKPGDQTTNMYRNNYILIILELLICKRSNLKFLFKNLKWTTFSIRTE